MLDICDPQGPYSWAEVSAGAHQLLVGGVGDPFAPELEIGGEGALRGMLHFFLLYPPSVLGFGTTLVGLKDEIVLAVPSVTFVLVVPLLDLSRVGSGVFFRWAFLLRGFGGLRGIFECGEVEDCGCCCGC